MEAVKLKKLEDHSLYNEAVKVNLKGIRGEISENQYNYAKEVQARISALLRSLKTLQIARILVAEVHPEINIFSSTVKITDYLRYNIENYFLRVTVYKDLILSLINTVYQWEISNNTQFIGNVSRRARMENNDAVIAIINRLKVLMTKVTPIRNRIAHQGSILSDLTFVEGADYLKEVMPEMAMNEGERNNFFIKIVEDNLSEMLTIEEDLATDSLLVFDILQGVFTTKITGL